MQEKWFLLILAFVLGFLSLDMEAQSKVQIRNRLKDAMWMKNYRGAIELCDKGLGVKGPNHDYFWYMKALAQFYQRDYLSAQFSLKKLFLHKKSIWRAKGKFMLAQIYLRLKDYRRAQDLYSLQAQRLHSPARKRKIANVYIRFAKELSREPKPEELRAPKPNYYKAYIFYKKALELKPDVLLTEELTYLLGYMKYKGTTWYDASGEFERYLKKYDPSWVGYPSKPVPENSAKIKGKHRAQVRYYLAECLLKRGYREDAREVFSDLISFLQKEKRHPQLVHDATWQLTRTWRSGASQLELSSSVDYLERYLKIYPKNLYSVQAAYQIGANYLRRNRTSEAIVALQRFLRGEGYQILRKYTPKEGEESPLLAHKRLKSLAMYELGKAFFLQQKYEKAIEVWNRYTAQFPNGKKWANVQQGILDAEYQMGEDMLSSRKYDKAIKAWKKFLSKYPLDMRAQKILYVFGEIKYQFALAEKKRIQQKKTRESKLELKVLFELAIQEWEKLISKHNRCQEAQTALYRCGLIYEEELQDLKKALETYRRIRRYGHWYTKAQRRISSMTKKHLSIKTERVYRSNENVTVKVRLRNIKELTIRTYPLDLEAYFRKKHKITNVEDLDISLIQPEKIQKIKVKKYKPYLPLTQDIIIAMKGPGVYAVNISGEDLEATTLVIRSDLEFIVKSSRRELLVFVQDMLKGKQAPGIRVLVSNGQKIVASGETNINGVWQKKLPELKDMSKLSVFVEKNGHVASNFLSLRGLGLSLGLSAKGYIFTDRPAYRPGEKLHIRGIIREVIDGSYVVPKKQNYSMMIFDSMNRLLLKQKVKLSSFGTTHKSFQLAEKASVGEYRILLKRQDKKYTFQTTFLVNQLRLEKVKLSLSFPHRVYFRGEKIEATFSAQYYYGTPVVGKKLRYVLPNGQSFVVKTNDKGLAKIMFDTSRMRPGSSLTFRGRLETEGIEITERVFLARHGFSISISPSRKLILSGENVELTIQTKDAMGKALGKQLLIEVYRIVKIQSDPVLSSLPWKKIPRWRRGEEKLASRKIQTDASGEKRTSFILKKEGNYIFRVKGKDRFGNLVQNLTKLYVSDEKDITKLRIFSSKNHLKVGENLAGKIHSRLAKTIALITYEGETILNYKIMTLKPGANLIQRKMEHKHFPNFQMSVAVMDGNRFYQASQPFTVERKLQVQVQFKKKHYRPGEKAEVEITTLDHQGLPVQAEISLALVDEALYAITPDRRPLIVAFFQKGARRVAKLKSQTSCIFSYKGKTKKVLKEIAQEILRVKNEEKPASPSPRRYKYRSRPSIVFEKPMKQRALNALVQQNAPMRPKLIGRAEGFVANLDREKDGKKSRETVRKELAALGFWSPSIRTNKKGKAKIEIKMPEKITEWRITAIGCTQKTLVGEIKSKVLTRKDFFLDLKLPSHFTEGDRPRILGRIHNLSHCTGKVKIVLEMMANKEKFVYPKEIFVKQRNTTEFVFDEIEIPASLKCTFKATAHMQGKDLFDSVRYERPTRPWGMEYARYKSGSSKSSTTVFMQLPHYHYQSRWMSIIVAPTMWRTVLQLAMYRSPRHCQSFAHVASDLQSCIAALKYASKSRKIPGDHQKLMNRARELVGQIVVSQQNDGGWRKSRYGSSNIVISARMFWALSLAKNFGIGVDEDIMSRGTRYLQNAFRRISHRDNETKALVQYVLSLTNHSDFQYGNRLYRNRFSMGTAALSYTSLLLNRLQKRTMALQILQLIQRKKTHKGLWSSRGNSTWTKNDVENVALIALAFEKTNPSSFIVKQSVDYLLRKLRHGGFSPYHSKGLAIMAIAGYYSKTRHVHNDYWLTIYVNNKDIGVVVGSEDSPIKHIQVPKHLIRPGKNRIEFFMMGSGTYTYSVNLRGFSSVIRDPRSWRYPYVYHRQYRHAPLEYKGKSIGVVSSTNIRKLELGQETHVYLSFNTYYDKLHSQYLVVEEPIPSGCVLVKNSIRGQFSHYEILPGRMLFYFDPQHRIRNIRYKLAGYAPGHYKILPTTIRDLHNPSLMRMSTISNLTILGPGEKSDERYYMNNAELYRLGQLHFNDGEYNSSLQYLSTLFKRKPTYSQREVARMLLWIYTEKEFYNARKIVEFFEILKEKYPQLYIPFSRILLVGKAYKDIHEYERAYLVYFATIEATFEEEAKIGGVLEDQREYLGSIDYMRELWRHYHDSASIAQAYFGLSQSLYEKKNRRNALVNNVRLGEQKRQVKLPTKKEILEESIVLLREYLSLYPQTPQADDASFSLASAYLDLDYFLDLIDLCRKARPLYKKSKFVSSFRYMEALGHFSLGSYKDAIEQAEIVAKGKSKDKNYAMYILGQIYHASSKIKKAIQCYKHIKNQFPDARESILYFTKKSIKIPEISKIRPGEKAKIKLTYSNIQAAHLLVYKVDLMKIYLQRKNLSGITQVDLAGIKPEMKKVIPLGNGKDYCQKKKEITLNLKDEGAYLIICRGDDLFTSGLALVTPLKLEVQENPHTRRVRVNVINILKNSRPQKIHIKVIGSESKKFVSGATDLRGVFIADNIRGRATVICRHKTNQYAFYRGKIWLGPQKRRHYYRTYTPKPAPRSYDFRSNLQKFNKDMQIMNQKRLYRQMRRSNRGVQIQRAKK